MQFNKKILTACILAAASSSLLGGVLWFSLARMQFFIILLFGLSVSLPILIVTFGYGTHASIFSAALATIFLLFILLPVTALLIAVFFFAPSVFTGWLMGLAQNGRKNTIFWYPFSQIVFLLALAVISATIIIMLYLLSSADTIQYLNGFFDRFIMTVRENNLYPESDQALFEKAMRIHFIPSIASVLAGYGSLFQLGNLYFSTRLAKKLGHMNRPLDNWPSALRMPLAALVTFGISGLVILFSINETITICANIIISALGVCFFASGLAFIHYIIQNHAWRAAVLTVIYIGLFTLVFTLFFVMALILAGLFATFLPLCHSSRSSI
ncbi:MAG: hypothetical protein JSC189_001150 [Candidatus Tokpelaia sp. JSC189]|nr:MAG: hypothetical protein JSC189_001150 [Candidatus Tokpelaia sp. JSC189]